MKCAYPPCENEPENGRKRCTVCLAIDARHSRARRVEAKREKASRARFEAERERARNPYPGKVSNAEFVRARARALGTSDPRIVYRSFAKQFTLAQVREWLG